MRIIITNYKALKADCAVYDVKPSEFYKLLGEEQSDFYDSFGWELSKKTTRSFSFQFIEETETTRVFEYIGLIK